MLIYRALYPLAWVTGTLFKDCFLNNFAPEAEHNLKQIVVLLIIYNAPGYPQNVSHPNIQMLFLPSNTTSLLQPLHQGIIYTFKVNNIRKSLQWILDTVDLKSIYVKEARKQFSINNCIDLINLSLKELKISTLNACWKKILPVSVEIETIFGSIENAMGKSMTKNQYFYD